VRLLLQDISDVSEVDVLSLSTYPFIIGLGNNMFLHLQCIMSSKTLVFFYYSEKRASFFDGMMQSHI